MKRMKNGKVFWNMADLGVIIAKRVTEEFDLACQEKVTTS